MLELNYARRARRHVVDLPCELIRGDHDEPINHRIRDLSAYGAWIQTTFPLRVGQSVVLTLRPPGVRGVPAELGIELTCFAEITRAIRGRSSGMGLELVLNRNERAELLGALRRLPDESLAIMRFARQIN